MDRPKFLDERPNMSEEGKGKKLMHFALKEFLVAAGLSGPCSRFHEPFE
jgi:hypothetical protein